MISNSIDNVVVYLLSVRLKDISPCIVLADMADIAGKMVAGKMVK